MLVRLAAVGVILLTLLAILGSIIAFVYLIFALIYRNDDLVAVHFLWNVFWWRAISYIAGCIVKMCMDTQGLR